MRTIEPKLAEVTRANRVSVHPAIAANAAPHARNAVSLKSHDRLLLGPGNSGTTEKIRLPLECDGHSAMHGILAQKPAERGVVSRRPERVTARQFAGMSWPCHDSSPSG